MTLLDMPTTLSTDHSDWPEEVRAALHALETAFPRIIDRRLIPRSKYMVRAAWQPAGVADFDGHSIFTRDVNPWSLGFLTSRPLEVGHRAVLRLPDPDGAELTVPCILRRCQEFISGWSQAYADFAHEQPVFATHRMR